MTASFLNVPILGTGRDPRDGVTTEVLRVSKSMSAGKTY